MNSRTAIERGDISTTTHEGHPAFKIGDAILRLRTAINGKTIDNVEVDYTGDGPLLLLLDEDDEILGELAPEFAKEVPADG